MFFAVSGHPLSQPFTLTCLLLLNGDTVHHPPLHHDLNVLMFLMLPAWVLSPVGRSIERERTVLEQTCDSILAGRPSPLCIHEYVNMHIYVDARMYMLVVLGTSLAVEI